MNTLIILLVALICGGVIWFQPGLGPGATAVCAVVSLPTLMVLLRDHEDRNFLLRLFVLAVLVRIALATVIFMGGMEGFFGGDANTYDMFGKSLLQSWQGDAYHAARYAGF